MYGLAAARLGVSLRVALKWVVERGGFHGGVDHCPVADVGPKLPGEVPVCLAFDGMFEVPNRDAKP